LKIRIETKCKATKTQQGKKKGKAEKTRKANPAKALKKKPATNSGKANALKKKPAANPGKAKSKAVTGKKGDISSLAEMQANFKVHSQLVDKVMTELRQGMQNSARIHDVRATSEAVEALRSIIIEAIFPKVVKELKETMEAAAEGLHTARIQDVKETSRAQEALRRTNEAELENIKTGINQNARDITEMSTNIKQLRAEHIASQRVLEDTLPSQLKELGASIETSVDQLKNSSTESVQNLESASQAQSEKVTNITELMAAVKTSVDHLKNSSTESIQNLKSASQAQFEKMITNITELMAAMDNVQTKLSDMDPRMKEIEQLKQFKQKVLEWATPTTVPGELESTPPKKVKHNH
jgi:hypothetical protein